MAVFRRLGYVGLWLLMCWPLALRAEIVVVTTADSPVPSLNQQQVRDLFLGKVTALPDRTNATVVDQAESQPIRYRFSQQVMNKTVAQLKAHWARLYFTGRAPLPREANGNQEVKKLVASTPGAIGYIERPALDGSVKVLFSTP